MGVSLAGTTEKKPRRRVEVYRAADGFRFRAIAGNGREDGASEEGKRHRTYVARQAAALYPDRPVIIIEHHHLNDHRLDQWHEWSDD